MKRTNKSNDISINLIIMSVWMYLQRIFNFIYFLIVSEHRWMSGQGCKEVKIIGDSELKYVI